MIDDNDLIDDFDELDEPEEGGALFEHYNVVVDPGQTFMRIDKFLANRRKSSTRTT